MRTKEEKTAYNKEWKELNSDKLRELRLKNADAKREYDKEYRLKNKNKLKERHANYRENNKEKISKRSSERHAAHKEEINKRSREKYATIQEMNNNIKPSGYWNKERCNEVALLCKTRSEFRSNYVGAYNVSRRNGWLNDFCSHMEVFGNLRKRLVYSYEFSDNHVYVGITCNKGRRDRQHNEISGSVYEYIQKTGLTPIKKELSDGYIDVVEAQKLEKNGVAEYRKNGWNILNRTDTGGLGGNIKIWNKEKCKSVALLCKTRKEFSMKYSSAYISSRKNGWLNEICLHMIIQKRPNGYWNYETCKEAALNYNTRFDFSHKCSGAYFISHKNNWLDEFYPKAINI